MKISGVIAENHYELTRDEQIDWLIENYYPKIIDWLEQWMAYKNSKTRTLDVGLTEYTDLAADQNGYVKKMFDFFGYGGEFRDEKIETPREESYVNNFRKGKTGSFREELSNAQIKTVTDKLPAWSDQFNWT